MSRARDLATFVSNADGDIKFDTDTLFIDSSENRVGIGTDTPTAPLTVDNTTNNQIRLRRTASGNNVLAASFSDTSSTGENYVAIGSDGDDMVLRSGNSEAVRIDSSGNLLVSKTSSSISTEGVDLRADGQNYFVRDGGTPIFVNRLSSDGTIVDLRRQGSTVGSIGSTGANATFISSKNAGGLNFNWSTTSNAVIKPCNTSGANADNLHDLGTTSARFDDIYATNGTIQTSDRNEKQDIAELDETEKRVATAAKGLIKKYRWIDAVEKKGDDARIHVGIIAQDLQAAFEAEGLDAGRYAMFISSTWWEADEVIPAVEAQEAVYETQTDEEGNETQVLVTEAVEAQPERTVTNTYETAEEAPEGATERTRLGVRYSELLAFIIGAM